MKAISILAVLMLVCGVVYADNSVRIAELVKEQEKLQARWKQNIKQQEQLKERFVAYAGAIEELMRQDEATKSPVDLEKMQSKKDGKK